MNRSSLPVSVNTMKKWYESDDKVLQCTLPFQRHSGMWNTIVKSNLIWSILSDSYIPPVVLLKDKRGVDAKGKDLFGYQVLEGQQRLITTLFPFLNDEWALHGATEPVEVDGFTYDIAGKKFSELEEELRDIVKNYRFTVQAIENYTMEEAEKLYFNINSGVALSAIQKGKAKLGTEMIEFLNSLLSGNFFTQAINITESQALKEDDLLMLMQGMALLDQRHEQREFKNISAATMLAYAESIRGTYNDNKREMLLEIVDFLNKAFTTKNKFLRKNNTPIVIVMAKIALEQEIEPEAFRAFINDFANSLYPAYEEASGSGNVKIVNVNMRLRVMFLAMCDYFKWSPENLQKPFADAEPLFVEVIPDEKTEVNLSDESVDGIGGMAIGIVDDFIKDETATEDETMESGEDSAEEEVCADEEE
ncbi:MAG: DUF262 domain-containing protein [Lachnospiraceae bacterium]|nr:DUF262 domain-containing protein [Lachnospiraceae bacterium]